MASDDRARIRPGLLMGILSFLLVHVSVLLQALRLLWGGQADMLSTLRSLALAGYKVFTIATMLHMVVCHLQRRLTAAQSADWNLLYFGALIPTANVMFQLCLPTFDVSQRHWPSFLAFLMAMGVTAADFPLSHTMVQWLMTVPPLMFLDYCKACRLHEKAGLLNCLANPRSLISPPSFLTYLLTHGVVLMASGLAAVVVSSMVSGRYVCTAESDSSSGTVTPKATSRGSQSSPMVRPVRSKPARQRCPPFETFGFGWIGAWLGPTPSLLEAGMTRLCWAVDASVAVGTVCLPIGGYYLLRTLLARVNEKAFSVSSVTAEEWTVAMLAFFNLGWQASSLDFNEFSAYLHAPLAVTGGTIAELVDSLRRQVSGNALLSRSESYMADAPPLAPDPATSNQLVYLELLGEGEFGKAFRGLWRGSVVAIKLMYLPRQMGSSEKRERMAIMEAAISNSLSHPNIVQTYTFGLAANDGQPDPSTASASSITRDNSSSSASMGRLADGLQVQIVMEFCELGSLYAWLRCEAFLAREGMDYDALLETAADIAKGMAHLHSLNIVHSDLKAQNVLLRGGGSDARGFTAKISDFGLSFKMSHHETHVMGVHHGTLTHMSPEVLLDGRQSKAADVYAFGILLWEIFTGGRAYDEVPSLLIGHQVVHEGRRPAFPVEAPAQYVELARSCWHARPEARPSFEHVVQSLGEMLRNPVHQYGGDVPSYLFFSTHGNDESGGFACHVGTPAERTVGLLGQLLRGEQVDVVEAAELQDLIVSGGLNLHRPPVSSLMSHFTPDQEVNQSLMTMLLSPGEVSALAAAAAQPKSGLHGIAKSLRLHDAIAEEDEEQEGGRSEELPCDDAALPGSCYARQYPLSGRSRKPVLAGPREPIPEDTVTLLKGPGDKVLAVLAKIDNWQFDCFELSEVSGGRPLSTLTFAIMHKMGLVPGLPGSQLSDQVKLARFLQRVEQGYPDNPYHSKIHAADVVRTLYCMLTHGGVLQAVWPGSPDTALMVALLSAVIHDYEHKGFNNDFLIKSSDELALRYNDRSPMENHHLSAAFSLLQDPLLNFMHAMPTPKRAAMRKEVIEAVLATDMKSHFSMVSLFNTKFTAASGFSRSRSSSMVRSFASHQGSCLPEMDEDLRRLVLQVCLKCADLGHLAAPWGVHRRWVQQLEAEFFNQGDCERSAGLPISPLMDRTKEGITRSQPGFFNIVALPLYQAFCSAFAGCMPLHDGVKDNFCRWNDLSNT